MKILILLFMLMGSNTVKASEFRHFQDWTSKEKTEFALYSALSYIDYRQTSWAARQQDINGDFRFREMNPIMGNRPSNKTVATLMLAGVAGYYYLIGDSSNNPQISTAVRSSLITFKLAVIVHNDSIGVSFSKAW